MWSPSSVVLGPRLLGAPGVIQACLSDNYPQEQ